MNMNIKDFAKQIEVDKKEIISIVKKLGIKKTILNKEEQKMVIDTLNKGKNMGNENENKERTLKKFHEKLIEERDRLHQEKEEFKSYKEQQNRELKEKLLQEEINHKTKLEELRIQTITKLKDEFLKNIKNEYDKVNSKLDELTQKELKLIEWQQELNNKQKTFESEKKLFESEKEKLLNEHKAELEKEKIIFKNKLEEEKVKEFENININIKELYKDKENELNKLEETLQEKENVLKTRETELKAKEKYLENQKDLIYKQEKEKVQEEIKNYIEKIESFEKHNQLLREELNNLREELNNIEDFEGRDLVEEVKEKQQAINRLNILLEENIKIKNNLKLEIDKINIATEKKIDKLNKENIEIKTMINDTERLKSENEILKEKLNSTQNHIELLQGENKDLNDRLKSIYSDGTEIEERIKDIKSKPYKEIILQNQIIVDNEIEYLDSIQNNMKRYGVEYPKRLLYAFHTALKSADFSPLSVLSGVSGTGKSELPKLYSHFGGFNFLAEAVQPTWDSPASMIGYYNTIDRKFDSTNILKFLIQTSLSKNESPFGLKESMNMILLDEMNLAHIELYFAEFLSKFEQRRGSKEGEVNIDIQLGTALIHKLPLDRNMLWIGTMNEDETTKSLSDKVLDRAFSINFPRPTELKSRTKLKSLEDIKPFEYLHRDTWNQWIQQESLFTSERSEAIQKYKEISNNINDYLAPTGRAIGHRVWQSMEFYISNHPLVRNNLNNEDEFIKNIKLAFEDQLVQKIMPKLRGIEVHGKEKDALMNIKEILNQNEFAITEDFELSMDNPYGQFIWNSANYLKED